MYGSSPTPNFNAPPRKGPRVPVARTAAAVSGQAEHPVEISGCHLCVQRPAKQRRCGSEAPLSAEEIKMRVALNSERQVRRAGASGEKNNRAGPTFLTGNTSKKGDAADQVGGDDARLDSGGGADQGDGGGSESEADEASGKEGASGADAIETQVRKFPKGELGKEDCSDEQRLWYIERGAKIV